MKIAYGAEVEDKNGNYVGQVNHVIRDNWTGGIRKFGVWNPDFEKDVMLSPDEVQEMKTDKIVLAVPVKREA